MSVLVEPPPSSEHCSALSSSQSTGAPKVFTGRGTSGPGFLSWRQGSRVFSSALGQRRAFCQGRDLRGAFGGLRLFQACNFQEAAGGADYLAGLLIPAVEFAASAHLYGRNLGMGDGFN